MRKRERERVCVWESEREKAKAREIRETRCDENTLINAWPDIKNATMQNEKMIEKVLIN